MARGSRHTTGSGGKVSERPIIFSGSMVRAILDGRKTQTRRIVKLSDSGRVKEPGSPRNWHLDDPDAIKACPYGVPGDRMWVREALAVVSQNLYYSADRHSVRGHVAMDTIIFKRPTDRTVPSIYMPRWASRLTLEVVSVRVERLQEISDADCISEGMMDHEGHYFSADEATLLTDKGRSMVRGGYRILWDSINAKRAPWESNPWVWRIEFRRVE